MSGHGEFLELVRGVKGYLRYLESLHLEGVPGRPDASASEPGAGKREKLLEALRVKIGDCRRCPLSGKRTNLVFGVGNPEAELVFVGEAPGRDEDMQGEPFVGAAGRLLTKIIQAMGLRRQDVYICNVVKCWPPGNRPPLPDEIAVCRPFLEEQLSIITPRCIVSLGSISTHVLMETKEPISRLRGNFHAWHGIPLMPTYHPAFLLRNPEMKKHVWDDVRKVMALLREKK